MNIAELIAAIQLPASARVGQRVPKKLLIENGAPTAADKRRINDGIEEIQWVAALKPTTVGVPEFRDITREYLEVAVLSAVMRPDAQVDRLLELIHRAVPYPVFLISSQADSLGLSFAHKRWSQGEGGAVVLDGALVTADSEAFQEVEIVQSFLNALPIARQPRIDLFVLYQGWIDTLFALLAAQLTGVFAPAESGEHAERRRIALAECAIFDAQITALRIVAAKERQIARQVELNLEIKRIEAAQAAMHAKL